MTVEICPNCNTQLRNGLNELIPDRRTKAINTFTINKSISFCKKCSPMLLSAAKQSRFMMISRVNEEIDADILLVPVITLQNPENWNYTVLKLITAQSVTGEGALTEFISAFTEAFGLQNPRLAKKLKNGEDICIRQLRMETFKAGGNAVIAVDIDFAQIGDHEKGLMMVCMSGTAVKLHNIEILQANLEAVFERIENNMKKLDFFNSFNDVFV